MAVKVSAVERGGRRFCRTHPDVETKKVPTKGGYDIICEECESAHVDWKASPEHTCRRRCYH
jgi:hypothetical protein